MIAKNQYLAEMTEPRVGLLNDPAQFGAAQLVPVVKSPPLIVVR